MKRYVLEDEPRYWFSAPRWGQRRAITWQGWAFDVGAVLACFAVGPYVRALTHPFKSLGLFFALLAMFVTVRRWKGEPSGPGY
jgi:hypothetical protein